MAERTHAWLDNWRSPSAEGRSLVARWQGRVRWYVAFLAIAAPMTYLRLISG